MDKGFEQGFSIATRVDSIYSLEALVENICDNWNIFDVSFGNILMASTEMFLVVTDGKTDFFPKIYSKNHNGTLIIGFCIDELFLDIAGLFQKDLLGLLEKPVLNFSEKCFVNIKTNTDHFILDFHKKAIELCFFVNSIHPQQTKLRQKLLDNYFDCIYDRKSAKRNV